MSSRPRGRPKKVMNKVVEMEMESCSGFGKDVSDPLCNQLVPFEPLASKGPLGLLMRARAALIIGKWCGLVYDCSSEEVLQGIADNIRSRGFRHS